MAAEDLHIKSQQVWTLTKDNSTDTFLDGFHTRRQKHDGKGLRAADWLSDSSEK